VSLKKGNQDYIHVLFFDVSQEKSKSGAGVQWKRKMVVFLDYKTMKLKTWKLNPVIWQYPEADNVKFFSQLCLNIVDIESFKKKW
jgi:hypothetical protein